MVLYIHGHVYKKHTLDYFCYNFKQWIQEHETDIHTWNQNPKISLLKPMHLEICLPHKQPQLSWLCKKKNPQISLLKIMHPEILVVL